MDAPAILAASVAAAVLPLLTRFWKVALQALRAYLQKDTTTEVNVTSSSGDQIIITGKNTDEILKILVETLARHEADDLSKKSTRDNV